MSSQFPPPQQQHEQAEEFPWDHGDNAQRERGEARIRLRQGVEGRRERRGESEAIWTGAEEGEARAEGLAAQGRSEGERRSGGGTRGPGGGGQEAQGKGANLDSIDPRFKPKFIKSGGRVWEMFSGPSVNILRREDDADLPPEDLAAMVAAPVAKPSRHRRTKSAFPADSAQFLQEMDFRGGEGGNKSGEGADGEGGGGTGFGGDGGTGAWGAGGGGGGGKAGGIGAGGAVGGRGAGLRAGRECYRQASALLSLCTAEALEADSLREAKGAAEAEGGEAQGEGAGGRVTGAVIACRGLGEGAGANAGFKDPNSGEGTGEGAVEAGVRIDDMGQQQQGHRQQGQQQQGQQQLSEHQLMLKRRHQENEQAMQKEREKQEGMQGQQQQQPYHQQQWQPLPPQQQQQQQQGQQGRVGHRRSHSMGMAGVGGFPSDLGQPLFSPQQPMGHAGGSWGERATGGVGGMGGAGRGGSPLRPSAGKGGGMGGARGGRGGTGGGVGRAEGAGATTLAAGGAGASGGGMSVLGRPFEDITEQFLLSMEEIGRGRSGSIRQCVHRRSNEVFACKTIPKGKIQSEEEAAEDVRREL
ncbi:unnamed protein product [Closterium sp. NIES-64]|nr:unnamed protein product [Closterium sp. NIES-64]